MRWNTQAIEPELAAIASVAGLRSASDVVPELAGLFDRIGIPSTLQALGLAEDRIGWVAEQSCGIARLVQNNPRPLPQPDMIRLVTAAYAGDHTLYS
jgi:alcohol dehydrogenase class IV